MSDIVIKAENLGKKYTIGHQAANGRYVALRDVLMQNARSLWNKTKDLAMGRPIIQGDITEEVWALKDVSFEVKRGEAVGIIGRNGAGKSTLLKILSRITEPTTGRATIKGRVASLLEVGTGFHPELSGRENIYLNGTILGMTRVEIKQKFDEIVAFAEVEKYLDTPVKRYSSGMYVRLAFAVAAYLEPEILLVDEVLAVGDAEFQKKCLGKMSDIASEGRTVLFVSHNMAAVNRLCHYGMWLNEGRLRMEGATESVVAAYLCGSGAGAGAERTWKDPQGAPGCDKIRLRAVRILNSGLEPSTMLDVRFPFYVEIEYDVPKMLSGANVALRIVTADGAVAFDSHDTERGTPSRNVRDPGRYVSRCEIPGLLLNPGPFWVTVCTDIPLVEVLFVEENVLQFHVIQTDGSNDGFRLRPLGPVHPLLQWQIERLDSCDEGQGS